MKIAVIGSSGYIAGYLLDRFRNAPEIEQILRIDQTGDADALLDLLHVEAFDDAALEGIDAVVFTAAISGPDQCAADYDRCWAINVTGTENVVERAMDRGCRVLFFSSDAVFGNIPGKVYDEQSPTAAETAYGRMKKAVEDRFSDYSLFKAIRLSYVVSARDKFLSYCLKCLERGETAEIFHPFYRNCITVTDVVDVVAWLLHHWEAFEPPVLNVAGSELVSRVRIADEVNRLAGGRLQYVIQRPAEAFYQNRPAITQMKSLYLQRYDILEEKSFTEKIQKELGGSIR